MCDALVAVDTGLLGGEQRRCGSSGIPGSRLPSGATTRAAPAQAGTRGIYRLCRCCQKDGPTLPWKPAFCARSCPSSCAERGSRDDALNFLSFALDPATESSVHLDR
jgi:hypothetical protein